MINPNLGSPHLNLTERGAVHVLTNLVTSCFSCCFILGRSKRHGLMSALQVEPTQRY